MLENPTNTAKHTQSRRAFAFEFRLKSEMDHHKSWPYRQRSEEAKVNETAEEEEEHESGVAQGWAEAQGRHGAGWLVEAAAAVSGVHSGSVHGTRSWWGRPGSWGKHCTGVAGAAGCGQGLE